MNTCALLGTELCRLYLSEARSMVELQGFHPEGIILGGGGGSSRKWVWLYILFYTTVPNFGGSFPPSPPPPPPPPLDETLSCYVECHHGNVSSNLVIATPNLIKALYILFRRPQLQTKSFPIPYSPTVPLLEGQSPIFSSKFTAVPLFLHFVLLFLLYFCALVCLLT